MDGDNESSGGVFEFMAGRILKGGRGALEAGRIGVRVLHRGFRLIHKQQFIAP